MFCICNSSVSFGLQYYYTILPLSCQAAYCGEGGPGQEVKNGLFVSEETWHTQALQLVLLMTLPLILKGLWKVPTQLHHFLTIPSAMISLSFRFNCFHLCLGLDNHSELPFLRYFTTAYTLLTLKFITLNYLHLSTIPCHETDGNKGKQTIWV